MEENENQVTNTEETTAPAEAAPVYSQMSIDYVANQMKKARKKGMIQGLLIAFGIVILTGLITGAISIAKMIKNGSFYARVFGSASSTVLDKESIDKIDSLYALIDKSYLEEVDKEQLQEGLYKGLLESLNDPYSVYYNKEEFAEMMEDTSGTFEGIGVYLLQDPDTKDLLVLQPIKNSPAEKAGMKADDQIVEVDGEDIIGQDINLVVSKMRGPKGTTVNVGVKRSGSDEIIRFDLVRDEINATTVDYKMEEDKIGYIAIAEFADDTANQFNEAYDDLVKQGMKALIIDLRSNGGGYVDTAVKVADKLIKEGDILTVRDKNGLSYKYEDNGDENYMTVPCVLLVDGNTASASEILTGALRDHDLVTIIGTKTFGKGITQIIAPLDDGSGVKITNSKYFTPDGEDIHGIGIEPDILVEWDQEKYKKDGTDNQLDAAKDYIKKELLM